MGYIFTLFGFDAYNPFKFLIEKKAEKGSVHISKLSGDRNYLTISDNFTGMVFSHVVRGVNESLNRLCRGDIILLTKVDYFIENKVTLQ